MGEFYKELEAECTSPHRSLDLTISLDLRDRNALEEAIPALQADLTRVRKFCDENLKEDPPEDMPEQNRRSFPVGSCGWIAPWMFGILETIRDDSGDFDQIKTLVKMLRKGYPLRKGYGIMYKGYFQNVLQLGHLFLDVAHDAASDFRQPVAVYPLRDANFEPIKDMPLFMQVVESYCGLRVYPNNIFPSLAFANPYLVENKQGRVMFMGRHKPGLLWTEIQNGFAQTREFLFNSQYSARQIPKAEIATLTGKVAEFTEKFIQHNKCCEQGTASIRALSIPVSPVDFYHQFNALLTERANLSVGAREAFDSRYVGTASLLLYPIEGE